MTRVVLCLAPVLCFAEGPASKPGAPAQVTARGRLVCLAEAMKETWQAEVPPVHDHILGFHAEPAAGGKEEKPAAYYTLLRTPLSEALFADRRFRDRTLELTARLFPGSTVIEVKHFAWIKDGKVVDVHYWCEVCSIRGVNPGPCACCQGEVELRESAAR